MMLYDRIRLCLLLCGLVQGSPLSASELTVTTSTGTYTGFINSTAPDVRQFLNIPYALPPTGERRWLPPANLTSTSRNKINAIKYPPSCPQYVRKVKSLYNQLLPQYNINNGLGNSTPGVFAASSSEDCLSLAIWTPTGFVKNLPVIVFIPGGGFVTGGIDTSYQLPYHWVQRTRKHIVVTINYRLNIMGFPNAAGLSEQNLGILDQRKALEWVRDHIAAFGGDSSKITLWGQSAGAESADVQNFAYPNDPIVQGFFMDSGSAFLAQATSSKDTSHSNFTFVAANVGCGGLNASAELTCMRAVPVSTIINFMGHYQDNSSLANPTQPAISFTTVPDETVVFSSYAARYALGALSTRPAIFSTCANEGVALTAFPPNQTVAHALTEQAFVCPAASSALLRAALNRTTYAYQFAGNFSNLAPVPWAGAYHASDLPLLFGTHGDFRGASSALEAATSRAMQDRLLAFMRDPRAVAGWPSHQNGGFLRFGADGQAVQNVTAVEVEGVCTGVGTYDSSP
ncbi:hypothetical protein MBLNU459_g2648t1 [Dothideomycetes sp. NU459]